MCKYGMLKKKDPMKDDLTYVDNPVESEFPGHWLPVSILKKIMEMRAQTPALFTKQKFINLKLFISKKYKTVRPYWDTKSADKTTPIYFIDNDIEVTTKTVSIKSLAPHKESFASTTKKYFTKPETSSKTTVASNKAEASSVLPKVITKPKKIQSSPIIEPETTVVLEKKITNSLTELTSQPLITTEVLVTNKMIETKIPSTIVPEPLLEDKENLTKKKTSPLLSTKLITESITKLLQKSTAEIKTTTTTILTEASTTEVPTETATKETIQELTKETKKDLTKETTKELTKEKKKELTTQLNKSTEMKKVLTTPLTTTTTTETGNPFY